jgi:hypothetical protein
MKSGVGSETHWRIQMTTRKPRKLSRRRFLALIAAGSAAVATAPARAIAAPAKARGVKLPAAVSPKMAAEIEKQKKSTADTLKTIRAYPLPPGSDMAFAFRPLRPGKK